MNRAFNYSTYVSGKQFLGRTEDCNILSNLISNGHHVALIAPPKSGKTSLIQAALMKIRVSGRQFMVGEFNLLSVRDTKAFLLRLGSTVMRAFAVSPDEYAALAGKYLSDTHFVFDERAFQNRDEVVSLSWDLDEGDIRAMLEFPYRIAYDKGIDLYLVMEEFQSILHIGESDRILRMMKEVMESHAREESPLQGKLTMIFSGSQFNAMTGIFYGSPYFFRLVERITPSQISEKDIIDYLHKGFLMTGKDIDMTLLHGVCRLFRGHMWYINHFAAICDSLSRGYLVESTLLEGLQNMISIHEARFTAIMHDLTTFQVSLLRAILDGNTRFSSSEIINGYHLNSSANVNRLKEALMKKEIIRFTDKDEPVVIDPLFEYWVRKYYFEIQD